MSIKKRDLCQADVDEIIKKYYGDLSEYFDESQGMRLVQNYWFYYDTEISRGNEQPLEFDDWLNQFSRGFMSQRQHDRYIEDIVQCHIQYIAKDLEFINSSLIKLIDAKKE